ncbi:hypothetical protein AYI70_g2737, partial [Smittium culicis]
MMQLIEQEENARVNSIRLDLVQYLDEGSFLKTKLVELDQNSMDIQAESNSIAKKVDKRPTSPPLSTHKRSDNRAGSVQRSPQTEKVREIKIKGLVENNTKPSEHNSTIRGRSSRESRGSNHTPSR